MAFYQILFWQNIPTQIKVWDDFDEIKTELNPKFLARIDQAAREQGLISEDDYLSQFRWGEEIQKPGTPEEVAREVKKDLEENFFSS